MKKLILMSLLFVSSIQSSDFLFNAGLSWSIGTVAIVAGAVKFYKYPIFELMLCCDAFAKAKLMLRLGVVSIKNRSEFFGDLLYTAVQNGDEKIVKFLLENGVSPHVSRGLSEDTAMHSALWNDYAEAVIILLLEFGADVNGQNRDGNTPLYAAICHKNLINQQQVVELLLKNGANVRIKNKRGMTALDAAVSYECGLNIINLLKNETYKDAIGALNILLGAQEKTKQAQAMYIFFQRMSQSVL